MNLTLDPDQQTAVRAVMDWARRPWSPAEQVFRLHGHAGTGKTTTLKEIVNRLGAEFPGLRVHFAAPTNQAASVARSKGLAGATTLHVKGLIYDFAVNSATHKPRFKRLPLGQAGLDGVDLLVVDEVSMVRADLAHDILFSPDGGLRQNLKVLAVGDPGQLWPVSDGKGAPSQPSPWAREGDHDAILTTVHRSKANGLILDVATKIRSGQYGAENALQIPEVIGDAAGLIAYDQVIAFTNEARWHVIDTIRRAEGRPAGVPTYGDRLVLLASHATLGVKGDQFRVEDAVASETELKAKGRTQRVPFFEITLDDGQIARVPAATFARATEGDGVESARKLDFAALTFAQCVTAHKAQGSEWDRVLIVREHLATRTPGWTYTAVTRARVQCDVIRPHHLPSGWTQREAATIRAEWIDAVRCSWVSPTVWNTARVICEGIERADSVFVAQDFGAVAKQLGRAESTVMNHMTSLRKEGWLSGKGDSTSLSFPGDRSLADAANVIRDDIAVPVGVSE